MFFFLLSDFSFCYHSVWDRVLMSIPKFSDIELFDDMRYSNIKFLGFRSRMSCRCSVEAYKKNQRNITCKSPLKN